MKKATPFLAFLCIALALYVPIKSLACSMAKVTINGKTYLGNNEDSWGLDSRIWFENAPQGKLGALYVGYGNAFPQGGMNEAGLAFDGLTIYPKQFKPLPGKKNITNPIDFIKGIMQNCKTVEEVRLYANQYNRQAFTSGEYLFADKQGNYIVMEPDTIIVGNNNKYIIANFCPSITTDKEKLQWARYSRGNQFLLNHTTDTGSNYCLALIDTMHECRKRLGDGTLYSFIADLQNGGFSLYFYHDYKHVVQFSLKQELAKGDHVLGIPALFPSNAEYQKLAKYQIPKNNMVMLSFLYLCMALFIFSALYFLMSFIRNRKHVTRIKSFPTIKLVLFALSLIMLYYLIVLLKHEDILYSQAPYQDYKFSMLNIAAYIPFIILALIIPLITINAKVIRQPAWHAFSKILFTVNSLTYFALIGMFAYWGLYSVL